MSTQMSTRQSDLERIVDAVIVERDEWAQTPDEAINEALETAVDTMLDAFAEGSIPAECRQLAGIVERAGKPWYQWKDKVRDTGLVRAQPANEFWACLRELQAARDVVSEPHAVPLETVAELCEQKVGPHQICEIYGWKASDGSPQLWKVFEEKAEPGKHSTKCEGWENPVLKKQKAKIMRERDAKVKVDALIERKLTKAEAVAPETLEELVAQGVSAEQICEMKRLTLPQLFAECDKREIPRPALRTGVHGSAGVYDQAVSEEVERSMAGGRGVAPKTADKAKAKP